MAQIKDLKRMCLFYDDCLECRLYNANERCSVCFLPDNLEEIVDKWVEEQTVKTYAMDFFEKFPNAPKGKYGEPQICIKTMHGRGFRCLDDCIKCWNQEMKGE